MPDLIDMLHQLIACIAQADFPVKVFVNGDVDIHRKRGADYRTVTVFTVLIIILKIGAAAKKGTAQRCF